VSLRKAAHALASVPMAGGLESLNVGAAAAICLFERVRQRRGS
jgi:TrmH family RNA methyltransferase